VLDAKGEKLRLKQMDQLPLENFENSRVRTFVLSKYSKCLFLSKLVSCGENVWLWEKGGVFESLINFSWNASLYASTRVFDLEIGNWVDLQKQTKWWQRMIQICQIWIKNNSCSYLHWYCTSMCFFMLCWHKSPKRERLKGKCALGPFLSILVIKCQHKWFKC
jgi:hypothetical protein